MPTTSPHGCNAWGRCFAMALKFSTVVVLFRVSLKSGYTY